MLLSLITSCICASLLEEDAPDGSWDEVSLELAQFQKMDDLSDIEELFLQQERDEPRSSRDSENRGAGGRATRRGLYTIDNGKDCEQCLASSGYKHCWARKSDGSGSWGDSYCCTASDQQCKRLDYCSDRVLHKGLAAFTCPVDKYRCETGSKAQIRTRDSDKEVKTSKKFPKYYIRATTYCKYSIKNFATITTDRFKHNNMNINIKSENLAVYLIWIPRGTPWGNRVRVKQLKPESVNVFKKISSGNEWWLLIEPKINRESYIEISSTMSLEDMPADEKAAILKVEADEGKKTAEEKQAELDRIAAEKEADQERLAKIVAEKKAEEERIAAEEKAEEEKIAAERKAAAEELDAAKKKVQLERIAAEEAALAKKIAAAKKALEKKIAAEKKAEEERVAKERKAEEERIAAKEKADAKKLAKELEEKRLKELEVAKQ